MKIMMQEAHSFWPTLVSRAMKRAACGNEILVVSVVKRGPVSRRIKRERL
jgi:hypothetical protein